MDWFLAVAIKVQSSTVIGIGPIRIRISLPRPQSSNLVSVGLIFLFLAVFFLCDLESQTTLTSTSIEIQGPFKGKLAFDSTVGSVFSLGADPAITRPQDDIGVDGEVAPAKAAHFIGRVLDNDLMVAKRRMLHDEVGEP